MPGQEAMLETGSLLTDFDSIKQDVHNKLVNMLNFEEVQKLAEQNRRGEIRHVLENLVNSENPPLSQMDRERLIQELLNDTLGLGPLEQLLRDPSVDDILVNSPQEVYVERHGKLQRTGITFKDNDQVLHIIDRIVSRVGRRIDEASPMVDARLQDGSRFNAIIAPLALRGATISIRRFGTNPLRLKDLIRHKAFTPEMAQFLEAAVKARLNIIISGGTGSGKTTLLNCLSSFIPPDDRIITIEDAAELQLQQPHVVQLESRPPNIEGKGMVTIRDLVRNALRMRPDRIVIGECRGGETLDMLQAMNTGHDGSMTTLHANSPRDTLARLETMIMMGGFEMPLKPMRQQVASAVNLLVQTNRLQGGVRRMTSITDVVGMEGDIIVMQDLFHFEQTGIDAHGKTTGRFRAMGVQPSCTPRLRAAGVKLPADLFVERVLMDA
ncbi:pilus assembly protein CpaF [Planctomycetaceae bacterium SCGC AG-212-F19]|nr:pilus assembly protein CpaF [Planctomycetaceae bacterium SCGC AG-212-F19]